MSWPFGDLAPGGYRVILADPPWRFKTYNDDNLSKKPERHYRTMPFAKIAAMPVAALAHPQGAMLALWTTFPMLDRSMRLLELWGFVYKTGGAWTKVSLAGKLGFGTGYIYREAVEPWLLARRGAVRKREGRAARSQRNAILAPVPPEHSRKPPDMQRALEALYPGPYCELFSRTDRPGWQHWGDEAGKFHEEVP